LRRTPIRGAADRVAVRSMLPDALLDVSVTMPPAQNVVGPPGVIVGVGGNWIDGRPIAAEERGEPLPSR